VRAVDIEVVRTRFSELYVDDEPDRKKRQANVRQQFSRGRKEAQKRGLAEARNTTDGTRIMVWVPDRPEVSP
jgi:hypothetical protein